MIFISYIIIILVLAGIDVEIYGLDGSIFDDIQNANNLQLIFFIIQIIIFLTPGFKGNEWTSNNLQKKGYVFDCSIEAKNKNEAIELAHTQDSESSE